MNDSQYKVIYNKLLSAPCPPDKLVSLKNLYANEINSRRRLESVTSLNELLTLLEKRDYLNPSNTEVLLNIAMAIQSPVIIDMVLNNNSMSAPQLLNRTEILQNSVFPETPKNVKDRVYQKIASDIGHRWMDFARKLHISEGYIDDLAERYKYTPDRVYDILHFHETNCDPRRWKSKLLNALSEARRNDLRNIVQNIFDTHQPVPQL